MLTVIIKMRKLWISDDWDKYLDEDRREGIRLRFEKGTDPELRAEIIKFINWLRSEYEFPMRVPIYLKNAKQIKAMNGDLVCATFFGPFDKTLEPYIRAAIGDYQDLLEERGKINALGAIFCSIAHEFSHYFQWIKASTDEELDERQAKYYGNAIAHDYFDYNWESE